MRFGRLWAFALVLLASCGGGGGGSASVSSPVNSVQITAYEGQTAAQDIPVTLEDGSGEVYASVRSEGAVQASFRITGRTTGVITVGTGGLSAGQHSGTVHLTLCSDAYCARVVGTRAFPVTVTVRPGLRISASSVSLSTYEGGRTTATGTVQLPDLPGTLSVVAQSDTGTAAPWLSVSVGPGSAYGVTASAEGLLTGSRQGRLVFTYQRNDGGQPFIRTIPVAFTIGQGLMQPVDRTLDLNITTPPQALTGSIAVAHAGGSASGFTASSNAAWLRLGATSGTTPATLTYTIDAAAIPRGASHDAVVTLSSPGLSDVRFTLSVNGALPRITGAMPYGLISGTPSRVVIGGSGFSQITNLSTSLSVNGLTPTDVRVVSDSELVLNVPAALAGRYTVRVLNAAGTATASSDIVVADPVDYTALAVPQVSEKQSIIYDHPRRSAYVVSAAGTGLIRFRFTGSGWQVDTKPLAGTLDAALSPDGSKLIVASGDRTLLMNVLDPDTLDTLRVIQGPTFIMSLWAGFRGTGMPVTANGHVWMINAGHYFDTSTDAIGSSCSTVTCGSDVKFSTPDGERLLALQHDNSPILSGSMWTLTTGALAMATQLPQAFQGVSSSSDGTRLLFDAEHVYRDDWTLVGNAAVTSANEFGSRGVISRDGRRVYRLIHDSNNSIYLRVDVFDAEAVVPGTSNLVRLGSIPLPAQAGSCPPSDPYGCDRFGTLTIAPDGRTLFWVANANLVVMPIPVGMRTQAADTTRPLNVQRWGR